MNESAKSLAVHPTDPRRAVRAFELAAQIDAALARDTQASRSRRPIRLQTSTFLASFTLAAVFGGADTVVFTGLLAMLILAGWRRHSSKLARDSNNVLV
jgi:hypothetical protein